MKSPIEQFEIVPFFYLEFGKCIDLTITNLTLICFIILTFLTLFSYLITTASSSKFNKMQNNKKKNTVFFIPNKGQFLIEYFIKIVFQIVNDNIGNELEIQKFIPFIFTLFSIILLTNLIGFIPYSFTATSHLSITFLLSFSIFIGTSIICFQKHNYKIIELFIPANTSFLLTLILLPIEFISYISKPVSLGVRLFINIMAGHCLLKIIIGFSWVILSLNSMFSLLYVVPILIFILLIGLELGVAVIQTYVFTVLTCIYLKESLILHN